MSGPKVSVYEISAQQRQNLRTQLNLLQQSLICREEIKKLTRCLNGVNGQVQSLLSTLELINRRTSDCSCEIAKLIDLQDVLPQACQSYMDELSEISLLPMDKFILSDAELEKRKHALAKLRDLHKAASAKHKETESALAFMSEKAKPGVAVIENAIADDVAGVQSFFVMPQKTEQEQFEMDKKVAEDQLRALALNTACPRELISEVLSASTAMRIINTKEQLQTFRAVTICPLQKRIESAIMKQQEAKSAYTELRTRLVALCSVAGMEPKDLPPDDGNLEQLKASVAELEKRIVMQTEQAYISDCVGEVMSEMGYDIIGNRSVVKRNGKRFRNELFSYGDGTAINVTYDSEGQIALELGGIDRADRIPTTQEADVLQGSMESFCSDFQDFEQRLSAKGVMIKSRILMAPPSAEYATIINMTDYTVTATTPVQAISVTEKRTRATAKHVMQKEYN